MKCFSGYWGWVQLKKFKRAVVGSLAGAALVLVASQAASAWGAGSWSANLSTCNAGTFNGSSSYNWSEGWATARTSESGNFCWIKQEVHVGIHDNWGHGYAWTSGLYTTTTYIPATYDGSWGGLHSWGNSGSRQT